MSQNRLTILNVLYILNIEVNVCRLLMVRDINNSVRKLSHLLYRWDKNSIVCKSTPSVIADGVFYLKVKMLFLTKESQKMTNCGLSVNTV